MFKRRLLPSIVALCIVPLFIASCSPSTRPTVKIGVVAPFVGRYREVGEEIIAAVRFAVREANEAGGIHGYSVELMAYDDEGDPTLAAEQARKLATDPQVVAVLGDWLDATTVAAAPVYAASQIPFLATTKEGNLDPSAFRVWVTDAQLHQAGDGLGIGTFCDSVCGETLDNLDWLAADQGKKVIGPPLWGLNAFPRLVGAAAEGAYVLAPAPLPADSSDPSFAQRYAAIASGVQPRFFAVLAYDATKVMLAAIGDDVAAHGAPSRTGVGDALLQTSYDGLSGHFSFDAQRQWIEAKGWVYKWRGGALVKP